MERADWMRGRYGLMYHYLIPTLRKRSGSLPGGTVDDTADLFDLDAFLAQFDATGADWLLFTLGQNTGLYGSPNAVIDRYAGRKGHCSARDLALELATALHARGKRFLAYLPCEIRGNESMHEGFAWTPGNAPAQVEFQKRWCEAIAEWATRLGKKLDGWWFDGCYNVEGFLQPHMRWDEWYAAARAGNPDAAVTFNDGCYCANFLAPIRPEFDYFAGEVSFLHKGQIPLGNRIDKLMMPDAEFVAGTRCRTQVLVPIDCLWGHGGFDAASAAWMGEGHPYTVCDLSKPDAMEPPYCTDEELISFASALKRLGAGLTLNVGCYADGTMGERTLEQLKRMRKALAAG